MWTVSDVLAVVGYSSFAYLAFLSLHYFRKTGARGHLTAALAMIVALGGNLAFDLFDYFAPMRSDTFLASFAYDVLVIAPLIVMPLLLLQFNIDFNHHLGWRGFIDFQLGFHYYSRKHIGSEAHNASKAISYFSRALDADPEAAQIYVYRGFSWGRISEFERAIDDYDRALKLNPSNALAWTNKGYGLSELGKEAEALEACSKATEFAPDVAEAWKYKGNALIGLSRYSEAITALNRAIQLEPDDGDTWGMKGYSLEMIGMSAEASRSFDQAHNLGAELKSD